MFYYLCSYEQEVIHMTNWEDDENLMSANKFYKFKEGENSVTILDDGEKVKAFGKACVEFKIEGGETLSLSSGPILTAIGEAKKELGSLVNRTLKVTRNGLGPNDTRYTDINVV